LEAFALMDRNDSGTIEAGELRDAVTALGLELSDSELKQMIQDADADGDGVIDRDEFVLMMSKSVLLSTTSAQSKTQMAGTFSMFSSNDKWITVDDLKRVAAELGDLNMSDADLEEMIDEASDGSGRVNRDAFIRIMNK
jgi:centrin-1